MIISVPSFIIPGTYLENVVHTAAIEAVQSIEFLCFIYDEETDQLLRSELPSIREYAGRFSYTLHMPDELKPEHRRIIDLTADIVRYYIIHPPENDTEGFLTTISDWIDSYGPVFLLENLIERDFDDLLQQEPRFPVCMDTGHLLIRGERPAAFCRRHEDRIAEIHLHGVAGGWDHKAFRYDEAWFRELLPFLESFEGICNIELFKERQVQEVLSSLRQSKLI